MRRRFFLIVLSFLVAAILLVSTLQVFYFESERSRLIDQSIETIASTLIASGLSLDLIQNLESTDDLIHDLLGEERVDQIINVYSLDGKILAQNYTGMEIPLEFNSASRWQTYSVKDRQVRVLNIPSGDILVQVGMILPPSLTSWTILNARFAIFIVGIFVLLLILAHFSSTVLFNPLKRLTLELEAMSARLDRKLGEPLSGFVIGPEWAALTSGNPSTRDEFELLCAEIKNFLSRLGDYTRSFNAQTAILTHELKTPLTILRNYLDEIQREKDLARVHERSSQALGEIERLTKLINDYLQWSVMASNPGQPSEIYAVQLDEVARKVCLDLNSIHHKRIEYQGKSEARVFALPDHLTQLINNLLSNALNYSSQDKEVACRVNEGQLEVVDQGPGIPSEVLSHLGTPFNRHVRKNFPVKSSGLGLAWVSTLCQKYGWKLDIQSSPEGTSVRVFF